MIIVNSFALWFVKRQTNISATKLQVNNSWLLLMNNVDSNSKKFLNVVQEVSVCVGDHSLDTSKLEVEWICHMPKLLTNAIAHRLHSPGGLIGKPIGDNYSPVHALDPKSIFSDHKEKSTDLIWEKSLCHIIVHWWERILVQWWNWILLIRLEIQNISLLVTVVKLQSVACHSNVVDVKESNIKS